VVISIIKIYDTVPIDKLNPEKMYSLILVNKSSGKPYAVWQSNNLAFPETDEETVVVAVDAPKREVETQLSSMFFYKTAFYKSWERYPTKLTVYENQSTQLFLKAPEPKSVPVYIEIERDELIETKSDENGEVKYTIEFNQIKKYGDYFKIRVYNNEWGRATTTVSVIPLSEFNYKLTNTMDNSSVVKLEEAITQMLSNPDNIDQTAVMVKNLLNGFKKLGPTTTATNLFSVLDQLDKDVNSNELLKHIQSSVPEIGKLLSEDKNFIAEIEKIAKEEGADKIDYSTILNILYKLSKKK